MITKFNPIEYYQSKGNLNNNEYDSIYNLIPENFYSSYKVFDRIILLAASSF
jgi:hypothetical protein